MSVVPLNSFAVHTIMDGYLTSASIDPTLFGWRLQDNLTRVLFDMWLERIIRLDWGLQPHSYWLIRALASRGTTPSPYSPHEPRP
jgi:hypothetical protein